MSCTRLVHVVRCIGGHIVGRWPKIESCSNDLKELEAELQKMTLEPTQACSNLIYLINEPQKMTLEVRQASHPNPNLSLHHDIQIQ